ncbi:MAG TPA: GNAT family N-acetyltransferase [Candidatus Dormibacteraeota bacterium]|nr:GNAT family N-acetyltransferase [Candidatus Dormibacteraeota bacterium]
MISVVRPAESGDAAAIARVHVETWRTAYRGLLPDDYLASLDRAGYEQRWARTLRDAAVRVFVAEDGGTVVGFASGGPERAGEERFSGELYAIYVLSDAQGHGHGRALACAVVQALREMHLGEMIVWVLRDNHPARHFYERLGGVYVRTQPIAIGSALLQEVSYGWRSLDDIRC